MILSLVVIRSADSERSAAFYRLLGLIFEKHRHDSGPEHFACELGHSVFEIYSRKDESESTSAVRLGFGVVSVDETVTCLKAAGAKIVSPPKDSPWGCRAVVDDPDGHRVELTEIKKPAEEVS